MSPPESCPPVIRRGNSRPGESRAREELSLLTEVDFEDSLAEMRQPPPSLPDEPSDGGQAAAA